MLDNGRGILFIKEFIGEDKSRYFMSVAKDYNGEWIFSTHTRKELKDIQKEVKKSKIFYNKGFKGEEVTGVSDILESGGTTTKPSDLQIEYPANHSSGINPRDDPTTNTVNLQNISLQDLQTELKTLSKDEITHLYAQSKNLDNKGSYIDSNGNIVGGKPKDNLNVICEAKLKQSTSENHTSRVVIANKQSSKNKILDCHEMPTTFLAMTHKKEKWIATRRSRSDTEPLAMTLCGTPFMRILLRATFLQPFCTTFVPTTLFVRHLFSAELLSEV